MFRHHTLRLAELAGNEIEMSRRPIVSGGTRVASRAGRGIRALPSGEGRFSGL
jgi:hypothetical protein